MQKKFDSTHTTPNALDLNELLSRMVQKGCPLFYGGKFSMLLIKRELQGSNFAGGVFTNITQIIWIIIKRFDNYIAKKGIF